MQNMTQKQNNCFFFSFTEKDFLAIKYDYNKSKVIQIIDTT